MSDDAQETAHEPDSIKEVIAHIEDKDWFLGDLIGIFANSGVEFPITLSVGGTTISGKLTSGRTYFEELSKMLSRGSSNSTEIQSLLVRMTDQNAKIYDRPDDAEDDWSPPAPGFIHLRDARIFLNGERPMPNNEGVFWRGKLTSVDGFWFGSLSAGDL